MVKKANEVSTPAEENVTTQAEEVIEPTLADVELARQLAKQQEE